MLLVSRRVLPEWKVCGTFLDDEIQGQVAGGIVKLPPMLKVMQFVSYRAQLMKTQSAFDPTPYLSVFEGVAFLEPRLLWKNSADDFTPPSHQKGDEDEPIEYFINCDRFSRLLLVPPNTIEPAMLGHLFPVFKSNYADRMVLDRPEPSARETYLLSEEQNIPSGTDLVEIHVPPRSDGKRGQFRFFSDDIQHFFPNIETSDEHAHGNAINREFNVASFQGNLGESLVGPQSANVVCAAWQWADATCVVGRVLATLDCCSPMGAFPHNARSQTTSHVRVDVSRSWSASIIM